MAKGKILSMITDHLIISVFYVKLEEGLDYATQTLKILGENNIAYGLALGNPVNLKEFVRQVLKGDFRIVKKQWYSSIIRPVFIIPGQRFEFVKKINIFFNALAVKIFLELRYRNKKKIVWLFEPYRSWIILSVFRNYKTIYDCVDYFSGLSDEVANEERHLLQNASHVFANSHSLAGQLRKYRQDVHVVPLGFAEQIFRKEIIHKFPRRPDHLIVGFVGGIDYRLDYDLLFRVVRTLPRVTFEFVGPILPNVIDHGPDIDMLFGKLRKFPNVRWIPEQSKNRIPGIIQHFDIGIIPYDIKYPLNKYCHPMKLMEYFYMGKPVVATTIEELKRFPKYVKIGSTAEEWGQHIKALLSPSWPKKYKEEQRRLAEENSWERKIEAVRRVIIEYRFFVY